MKEAQIYVKTTHSWSKKKFTAQARYSPSVYIANLSVEVVSGTTDEDKESLALSLLRVLEERLKGDIKILLEDTEEKHGFLETGALARLSDKLSRYVQRAVAPYEPKQWSTAID